MKNESIKVLGLTSMIFCALILGAAIIILACTLAKDKPIELRLAHMFPVGSEPGRHISRWARKIAEDSHGRLKIRIFPSNILVAAPEMYNGVVKGAADLGLAFRYKPEGYRLGIMFNFLLGAPNTDIAGKVYEEIWKKFPELMADEWKDVKIIYTSPSMPQYLQSKKPIHCLEDLKGQQIRVPSRELGALMKDLGAVPTFMPSADYLLALDKGTVDGGTGIFATVVDHKLGGKVGYEIMLSLGVPTPIMLIMNKESFDRLPPDLQRVLEKSGAWARKDSIKYWSEAFKECVQYCMENNIELVYLSSEEQARWTSIIDRSKEKVAAKLDKQGYPGTEILRFINERIKHHTRQ